MIKRTIASTKLTEDDELVLVELCDTMDYVVLEPCWIFSAFPEGGELPEKKRQPLVSGQ